MGRFDIGFFIFRFERGDFIVAHRAQSGCGYIQLHHAVFGRKSKLDSVDASAGIAARYRVYNAFVQISVYFVVIFRLVHARIVLGKICITGGKGQLFAGHQGIVIRGRGFCRFRIFFLPGLLGSSRLCRRICRNLLRGFVCFGLFRHGRLLCGFFRFGFLRLGRLLCGFFRFGFFRYGRLLCGVFRFGFFRYGRLLCGFFRFGFFRYGRLLCGFFRHWYLRCGRFLRNFRILDLTVFADLIDNLRVNNRHFFTEARYAADYHHESKNPCDNTSFHFSSSILRI